MDLRSMEENMDLEVIVQVPESKLTVEIEDGRVGCLLDAILSLDTNGSQRLTALMSCVADKSGLLDQSGASHNLSDVLAVRAAAAREVATAWLQRSSSADEPEEKMLGLLLDSELPGPVFEGLSDSVGIILDSDECPSQVRALFMTAILEAVKKPEEKAACVPALQLLGRWIHQAWTAQFQEEAIVSCLTALKHQGEPKITQSALLAVASLARGVRLSDKAGRDFQRELVPQIFSQFGEETSQQVAVAALEAVESGIECALLQDHRLEEALNIAYQLAEDNRTDLELRVRAIRALSRFPVADLEADVLQLWCMLHKMWRKENPNTFVHQPLSTAALEGMSTVAAQSEESLLTVLQVVKTHVLSGQWKKSEECILTVIQSLCLEGPDHLSKEVFTIMLQMLEYYRTATCGTEWAQQLNSALQILEPDAFEGNTTQATSLLCYTLNHQELRGLGCEMISKSALHLEHTADSDTIGCLLSALEECVRQCGELVVPVCDAITRLACSCGGRMAPHAQEPLSIMSAALGGRSAIARLSLPPDQAANELRSISQCVLAITATIPSAVDTNHCCNASSSLLSAQVHIEAVNAAVGLFRCATSLSDTDPDVKLFKIQQQDQQIGADLIVHALHSLVHVTKALAVMAEQSNQAFRTPLEILIPVVGDVIVEQLIALQHNQMDPEQLVAVALMGQVVRVAPEQVPCTTLLDVLSDLIKHQTLSVQFEEEACRTLGLVLKSSFDSNPDQSLYTNVPLRCIATSIDQLSWSVTRYGSDPAVVLAALESIALATPYCDTTKCTEDSGATVMEARVVDMAMVQALEGVGEVLALPRLIKHPGIVEEATNVIQSFASINGMTYTRTFLNAHSEAMVEIVRDGTGGVKAIASILETFVHFAQCFGRNIDQINQRHLKCAFEAISQEQDLVAMIAACNSCGWLGACCEDLIVVAAQVQTMHLNSVSAATGGCVIVSHLRDVALEAGAGSQVHQAATIALARLTGSHPGLVVDDFVCVIMSEGFELYAPQSLEAQIVYTVFARLLKEWHPAIVLVHHGRGNQARIRSLVSMVGLILTQLQVAASLAHRTINDNLLEGLWSLARGNASSSPVITMPELVEMINALDEDQQEMIHSQSDANDK